MPPRINNPVDDLINALQDESVHKAITALFDNRFEILSRMYDLLKENTHLRQCLDKANTNIDELEAYHRQPNLVISGLAITSYVDAASQQSGEHGEPSSSSISAENAVLELVNTQLEVKVSSSDITIAHRLKQRQPSNRPPSIIVCFTSMKVRDQVYRTRRSLKNSHPSVYINEDFTKMTASIY